MAITPNLNLELLEPSLWQSTYFKDFVTGLSGTNSDSNMMKLDAAIGGLQSSKADLVEGVVPVEQLPPVDILSLGETSDTAYRGDYGKLAYEHSLSEGNPHQVTKAQIGLDAVDNTADIDKPISTAQQAALDALTTQIGDVSSMLDAINGEVV